MQLNANTVTDCLRRTRRRATALRNPLLEKAMGDEWRDKSALAAMFNSANSTVGDKLEGEEKE